MPKKLTDRQRILSLAMSATQEQLEEALETFKIALANRFPRQAKKPATGRKSAGKQPDKPVLTVPTNGESNPHGAPF